MAKIYYDDDADLSVLADKTVAVIGYGIQGSAQALCLRDSGCQAVVAELEGTDHRPGRGRPVAGRPDPH